jgi:iron(III) transport system substrate-binding protein
LIIVAGLLSSVVTLLTSCDRSAKTAVTLVLYTSVDEPVARPILDKFTKKTGIQVELQTDSEKNKSVGLARRLEAERDNPQADVWWGNEVFHTINLADEGLLDVYDPPTSKDIPALFKDPNGRWTGNGLRARVMGINTTMLTGETLLPNRSILDLTSPRLRGKIAMANPSAGTTSGQIAALYVLWGDEKARKFLHDLHDNGVLLLGGNSVVADMVGNGTVWVGLTDNDDVYAAQRNDAAITLQLPDQLTFGTLTIPTTVGLVKGSKHPAEAKKLVDFLVSAEVEEELIGRKFANYAVRKGEGPSQIVSMQVDYHDVAKVMKRASEEAVEILEGRK